jgi:hypothetical protein
VTVNRERVKLLVDALRSGNFTQGKRRLRNSDGRMCCLGVACEVALGHDANIVRWETDVRDDPRIYYGPVDGDTSTGSYTVLPNRVAEWYGFETADPRLKTLSGGSRNATEANDDLGWDFAEIADAFERTYLALDESETQEDPK